jgi:hypothetical protein
MNEIRNLYELVEKNQTYKISDAFFHLLKENKPLAVKFAINCAYLCLDVYEKRIPSDKKPRQALETAEKWLANPTIENLNNVCACDYFTHNTYSTAQSVCAVISSITSENAYAAYASQAAIHSVCSNILSQRKDAWRKIADMYVQLSRKDKLSQCCFND